MNLSFTAELTKAEEVDGKLYLAGVASTTDVDKHRERMSPSALHDMAKTAVGVPLTNSHANELENQIGTVTEANVEGDKLVIKAEVDADDAAAVRLFKKVQKGFKAAFSVGGKITSDRPSIEKGAQRIITGVVLDHVMLTSRPANTNTFAVALAKTFDDLDAEDADPGKDITQKTTGDHMDPQDNDLEKAGAKFSADSKEALKGIHDAGNDDVKAKVRAMLGDEADVVLGAPNPDADGDDDNNEDDSDPIGIAKSETIDKDELKELISAELRKALGELTVTAKGSDDVAPAAPDLAKLSKTELWAVYADSLKGLQ